jgi:hypothetical protein
MAAWPDRDERLSFLLMMLLPAAALLNSLEDLEVEGGVPTVEAERVRVARSGWLPLKLACLSWKRSFKPGL